MIALAYTNKRFERAGKGIVIRKLAAEKFTCEIEALYLRKPFEGVAHTWLRRMMKESFRIRACDYKSFIFCNEPQR